MINRRGITLVMVIVALALIGVIMGFLTQTSQLMIYQTNRAHLQAVQRNMTLSALAWTRVHETDRTGTSVDLDTSHLGMKASSLNVRASIDQDNQTLVAIQTSCTKGRQTLRQDMVFQLARR